MAVSYLDPAERAWDRTRRMLLRPVDVERWIVAGFGAFLAGLAGQWAGISFTPRWSWNYPPDWNGLVQAPFENLLDAVRGSTWFLLGIPFVILALAVGVGLLWLSSRGKLIFLDNMVRARGALVEPWKRLGRLGDALFRWRLGFCVAAALLGVVVLLPLSMLGRGLQDTTLGRPFGVLATFAAIVTATIFAIIIGYVGLFLDSFVIPIMYRRDVTAVEAWGLFLPLLRARLPEFLVYGLVVLLACAAVFLGLIAAAIATCCILPLFLSVPYLSSVLLLPLTGFYRLYSVEFLGQFGPEYTLDEPAAEPAAKSPAGPDPEMLPRDEDGGPPV